MASNLKISSLIFLIFFIQFGKFNDKPSSNTENYVSTTAQLSDVTSQPGENAGPPSGNHSDNSSSPRYSSSPLNEVLVTGNQSSTVLFSSTIVETSSASQIGVQYSSTMTNESTLQPTDITAAEGSGNQSFVQLSSVIANETIHNQSCLQPSTTSIEITTTQTSMEPSSTSSKRTVAEQETHNWSTITSGFFAEPICVVKRGLWRSNLKLSPSETWLNKKECNILYCSTDGTLRSYACTFLNSTLVQRHKADAKINEAVDKCRKAYCL